MNFEYRGVIRSEDLNQEFTPMNDKVSEMLSIFQMLQKQRSMEEFVHTFMLQDHDNINNTLSAIGLTLSSNNKILLPLYLPINSINTSLIGGTFTLQRDWVSSVQFINYNNFELSRCKVTINGVELNEEETKTFSGLFSGSTWFIKNVGSADVSEIIVEVKTVYDVNEVRIDSFASISNRITITNPSPTQRYGDLHIIPLTKDILLKFNVPSVTYNGRKYLALHNIELHNTTPMAYGEIVQPIKIPYYPYNLTYLNVDGDYGTNQVRVVISNQSDLLVLQEEWDSTAIVYFDSNIDGLPFIGNSISLNAPVDSDIYIHVIIYNSPGLVPHIRKIEWTCV